MKKKIILICLIGLMILYGCSTSEKMYVSGVGKDVIVSVTLPDDEPYAVQISGSNNYVFAASNIVFDEIVMSGANNIINISSAHTVDPNAVFISGVGNAVIYYP